MKRKRKIKRKKKKKKKLKTKWLGLKERALERRVNDFDELIKS